MFADFVINFSPVAVDIITLFSAHNIYNTCNHLKVSWVVYNMQSKLKIVPLELKAANELVASLHRHHKPAVGHRFSIGVVDSEGNLRGAAIVGRPVARNIPPREVLEVTRLVTDGCPNACSALYSAAARIGKEMGYLKIQTYILESEEGISLRAAGWINEGICGGGQWKHTDGKPRRTDQPTCKKYRWTRILNG